MNIIDRVKAPTPRLFKNIRNTGIVLATISGILLTSPVPMPLVLIKMAGYLAVAGSVASAISQVTTENDETTAGDEPAV